MTAVSTSSSSSAGAARAGVRDRGSASLVPRFLGAVAHSPDGGARLRTGRQRVAVPPASMTGAPGAPDVSASASRMTGYRITRRSTRGLNCYDWRDIRPVDVDGRDYCRTSDRRQQIHRGGTRRQLLLRELDGSQESHCHPVSVTTTCSTARPRQAAASPMPPAADASAGNAGGQSPTGQCGIMIELAERRR